MSDTTTAITIVEKQLNTLEDKVRRGLASFMEVGTALQRIKETNGFRLRGFDDFNAYCERTFGFSASNGHKMITLPRLARPKIEAVEMRARRFGYFPRTFLWRGHEYQVEAVQRCWTTGTRRAKMNRHYFLVRCAEGEFTLYQDLTANTWHIQLQESS